MHIWQSALHLSCPFWPCEDPCLQFLDLIGINYTNREPGFLKRFQNRIMIMPGVFIKMVCRLIAIQIYLMKASSSGCVWWNSKDLCALIRLGLRWLLHFLTWKYRFLLRALTFLLSFRFMAIQLFQSTHIFNRETGAMSQLAESSTKQWRLADICLQWRDVPIGNFVRPYLHFKEKEQKADRPYSYIMNRNLKG